MVFLERLKRSFGEYIDLRNFYLLRKIGKWLYPSYRFKWPQLDWWASEVFNKYLINFNEYQGFNTDRRWNLYQLLRLVEDVPGDTAECGVYLGASSYLICKANSHSPKYKRQHYMFDSFEGLSEPTRDDGVFWHKSDLTCSFDIAKRNLSGFKNIEFFKGWIPDKFSEVENKVFSFVHVDVDLFKPTLDSILFFYPRLEKGGILLCDDYGFNTCPGATKAVDEFLSDKPEKMISFCSGGGFLIKGNLTSTTIPL